MCDNALWLDYTYKLEQHHQEASPEVLRKIMIVWCLSICLSIVACNSYTLPCGLRHLVIEPGILIVLQRLLSTKDTSAHSFTQTPSIINILYACN